MNIKSLLLGSAAALAAATGAHAADAIVAAEPEPLEYVRVCDTYGKGYFYIPGSETCLKVGGRVRTEIQWGDAYGKNGGAGNWQAGTLWHDRFELNVDTATDTEYGALKTNAVVRLDWQEGQDTKTKLLYANISLGGFLIGKLDSAYSTYLGKAGNMINDDVIYYGPKDLNQATYKYDAGNGFTAVVSLEDTNSADTSYANAAWQTSEQNHYAPNAVLGVGYQNDTFGFHVVGGYDSIVEEGAIKARLDAEFGAFSGFLMGGWNTDGNKMNQYAATWFDKSACPKNDQAACGWGDWAVWGGMTYTFNPKLQTNVQLVYTESKNFSAGVNLAWNPVKSLLVEPEVSYTKWDSVDKDEWEGIVRFERKF